MADDNKITETIKLVTGEDGGEPEIGQPAQNVVLDPSSPPVRSIVRVVLITLLILFAAGFLTTILTSLTYLFFLIILSTFFAYLIEPLVQMIRRPFENTSREKYMPRPLAIATAYLLVFSTIGIAAAVLTPIVSEQVSQLSTSLPTYATSIQAKFKDYSTRYKRYQLPEAVQEQINEKATGVVTAVGSEVGDFFISLISERGAKLRYL